MKERLFAIACDGNYFQGLLALLNSIYIYHGDEITVHVYLKGVHEYFLKMLKKHPLNIELFSMDVFPLPAPGILQAKEQVFAHCLNYGRCVFLLDADLVLTSRVDDVFTLAREGKIVASPAGNVEMNFGEDYRKYGPQLPGKHPQVYISSSALCLDVIRHWDLVGLWAFASQYGAYGPGSGVPLGLPGYGDHGVLNALAVLLNKVHDLHVLADGPWCDSAARCVLRIVSTDQSSKMVVWNDTDNTRQRLVHSSGPKWWTSNGEMNLMFFGDKLKCFLNFANDIALSAVSISGSTEINGVQGDLRILIGICSCNQYASKRKAVRDTWLQMLPPNITALFFIGEGGTCEESGLIQLSCPDDYSHLPYKVQSFYRYALKHCEFDYIFKCDDDTYVHPERLLRLPKPGVDFIGNDNLYTHGCAQGGAGYLMSREMVKRFANEVISTQGGEDTIFSALAFSSGLRVEINHELHQGSEDPPSLNNSGITAHWCDATRIRNIHEENFEKDLNLILKLKAKHIYWSGVIRLYSDGSFRGGNASPNGLWKTARNGNILILQWHHWPADLLKLQSWGFEEEKLRLEFFNPKDAEQWRRLQFPDFSKALDNPRIIVNYEGGLGNQLFQFAAGWVLAYKAKAQLSARPISGFPGTSGFNFGQVAVEPLFTRGHDEMHLDFDKCLKHLSEGKDVVINGYHQRYEILRSEKQELKTLLQPLSTLPADLIPGSNDLVVHIRIGDYFNDYFAPLFFYNLEEIRQFIETQTFEKLWIVTDSPNDPFILKIRFELGAHIINNDPLLDFAILHASKRLIITPSTFSWWAAWLGEAEEVHFPYKKGIWKNETLNLWVEDEERYEKY